MILNKSQLDVLFKNKLINEQIYKENLELLNNNIFIDNIDINKTNIYNKVFINTNDNLIIYTDFINYYICKVNVTTNIKGNYIVDIANINDIIPKHHLCNDVLQFPSLPEQTMVNVKIEGNLTILTLKEEE